MIDFIQSIFDWSLYASLLELVFLVLKSLAPVWAPIILVAIFWRYWVLYVQTRFINEQEYTVLQIKLPKVVDKSPKAMEVFLNSLYQVGGETTFIERHWKGSVRPFFSLEIASLEGRVSFYIWTRKFHKNMIESQLYVQYPGVEVHEIPDYTNKIEYDPDKHKMWGTYWKLKKEDAYPIKTYIDYGLDKDPKEEFKVDPIAPMIEYLGSLGKGEYALIQFVVRSHNKPFKRKPGTWFKKWNWREEGEDLTEKLLKKRKPKDNGDKIDFSAFQMTEGEREVIKAIERSISKISFECVLRGMYMADKEHFDAIGIVSLIGSVRQYGDIHLNSFELTGWTDFNYPWQDFRDIRRNILKRDFLDAYKKRGAFHGPHKRTPFVLNTEELATVFHLPGQSVDTPTIERISSSKAEAPSNIPLGGSETINEDNIPSNLPV
jgi:hypothetical protein